MPRCCSDLDLRRLMDISIVCESIVMIYRMGPIIHLRHFCTLYLAVYTMWGWSKMTERRLRQSEHRPRDPLVRHPSTRFPVISLLPIVAEIVDKSHSLSPPDIRTQVALRKSQMPRYLLEAPECRRVLSRHLTPYFSKIEPIPSILHTSPVIPIMKQRDIPVRA